MIRKIASFKYAAFGLFSVALISVACSDDDDAIKGGAGTSSGGSGSGGKNTTAGSSSAGTTNGGNAGSGTAGKTSDAGTGGTTAGTAGTAAGGAAAGEGPGGAGGEGGTAIGGEGGAVSGGAGGAGGEGGTPFVADVLDNPGFEVGASTDVTGWTNEGTTGAAYIDGSGAHSGAKRLGHWIVWTQGAPDYTARTYQTVGPIKNGTYSFSLWVDRDWETEQYLYARGFNAADPNEEKKLVTADEAGYTKYTLTGIPVTSGTVTIGIYTAAPAGSWANIDDAELVLE